MKNYPSFLKNEPQIFGITMSDIFKLTISMFGMSLMDMPQELILLFIALIYGSLLMMRRLYPRRHFEFLLKKEKTLNFHELIKKGKN